MNNKNKYKSKKNINKITIITTIFLFVILALTIGYSAFSDQLTITNIVSHIRVYKVVRINGVTTGSGAVSDLDYNTNSILNTVYIPAGGSVTYSVTATNLGNVPVAVSAVSFTNGNNPVNNLSSNVSTSNYIKICDNNVCTNGVSKTFDITITNNGSSTINTILDVNLTFSEVYTISYDGNQLGEAVAGSNYTYTFPSNAPSKLAKISGTCDSFNYTSDTLTITNVGSDLNFTEAHTVTYNGETQGYIANGGTYTYTFESQWPATVVKESGSSGNLTYDAFQTHTITIPNVTSDIVLTGTIGKVEIKRIDHVAGSDKNVLSSTQPTFSDLNASFSIVFQRPEGSTETAFETMYEVEIGNTHYDDYIFRGLDFNPQIFASADSDTAELNLIPIGIDDGEIIASGATKTFQVKLVLTPNNPDGNYSTETNTQVDTTPDTEEETGTITASINTTSGNLQSPNTLAPFTVTVTSTYPSDKEFRLISSNSNLEIVDANGNAISWPLTIHGESTETYQINVKIADGATFVGTSTTMSMYLSPEGIANTSVGNLTIAVDKYDKPDTTKVTVGNLQLAYYYDKSDSTPKIKATWDRKDVGGTAISDYVVNVYTTNGNVAKTCHTSSATRECLISGLNESTNYYAIVYGIDEAENSGASDVGSATQADGYATRSSTESWTWTYTVTRDLTNMTVSSGGNTAIKGSSYTLVFTADEASSNNSYAVPENMTVTMANSSGNFYTYQRNNSNRRGTITISEVTGNISISGSRTGSGGGICLVEGTKVKLYDGTYKNIEDIKYYDLLSVWSYDTGSLTYEYPIWIEKSYKTDSYQETTFSDGTILKTVGLHQVFSLDDNKFVNIYDENGYIKVGTRVAKEVDGKIVPVKVTKVETIKEKKNYYYVASSIYYNIITEDIITTSDQIVPGVTLSNMYGFDENIKWPSIRKEIINKEGALYNYKDLDVMPYYLYYGSRGNETKLFVNLGYATTPELIEYLLRTQLNPDKSLPPITDENGNRLWMITTSDDNIKDYKKHLHKEGYIYTLKEPKSVKTKEFVGWFNTESYVYTLKEPKSVKTKEFVGWFNTVDGKMYKVGEKYKLIHGTHFIAIYK